MPKSRGKRQHVTEILRGMARGPWAIYWARREEEKGKRFSGTDIYYDSPEAPRWALKWARDLADKVVEVNDGVSLGDLYSAAVADGFVKDKETFGFYLGMQATGEGVRWDDDLVPNVSITIKVPSAEFYQGAQPDMRFVE